MAKLVSARPDTLRSMDTAEPATATPTMMDQTVSATSDSMEIGTNATNVTALVENVQAQLMTSA